MLITDLTNSPGRNWRMPSRIISLVLICTVIGFVAPPAQAIVVRPAVSAGLGTTIAESDLWSAETGPTFGGELLFGASPALYFGASFDWSTFGLDRYEDDLVQMDINGSVRYFFPAGAVQFYAGGFAGYSRLSIDIPAASVTQDLGTGGGGGTASANGFNVGATLGLSIGVGPLELEISGGAAFNSFGELYSEDADQREADENSGMRFVGRIAVAWPLGAETR